MLSFQYISDTKTYNVSFEKLDKNHVKILGDIPVRTNGFILGRIGEPEVFAGDYSEYTTVYREIDGAVMQEVSTYEDLIVPTPIPNENYEFSGWNPEIPLSGEITENISFNAIFKSTLPEPEPEPTVEERVMALEEQNAVLEECLLEMSEVVYA